MTRSIFLLWVVLGAWITLGAGCAQQRVSQALQSIPDVNRMAEKVVEPVRQLVATTTVPVWREVDRGVARLEYSFGTSTFPSRILLYRFDQDVFTWRFAYATSARMVEEWGDVFPQAVALVNGVYFDEDFQPSGRLRVQGIEAGKRVFDRDKSGLIVLGTGVQVVDTATEKERVPLQADAAQSYPFFIKDGKSAIKTDSGYTARRTFIGTDMSGRAYLGVAVGDELSLFGLMTKLLALPVAWNDVLNLDGGPSTGVVSRASRVKEAIDSFAPVSNVIIVERKP